MNHTPIRTEPNISLDDVPNKARVRFKVPMYQSHIRSGGYLLGPYRLYGYIYGFYTGTHNFWKSKIFETAGWDIFNVFAFAICQQLFQIFEMAMNAMIEIDKTQIKQPSFFRTSVL